MNIEVIMRGDHKGFGTLPDGTFTGTLKVVQRPNGTAVGTDQGMLAADDLEVIVYKGSVTGKTYGGKFRDVTTHTRMTASQKLGWLSGSIIPREGGRESLAGLWTFRGTAYLWNNR